MSYYEDIAKRTDDRLESLAAQTGAPSWANRIPGKPAAYYVGELEGGACLLIVYRWFYSGRMRRTVVYPSLDGEFTFEDTRYWLDFRTYAVVESRPEDGAEDVVRKAVARRPFEATRVSLPRNLQAGSVSMAVTRLRSRKKVEQMVRHMPEGFRFLPAGEKAMAYRVDGTQAEVVWPKGKAAELKPGDSGALWRRFCFVSPDLDCAIGEQMYRLAPDGRTLYRAGHTEDIWAHDVPSVHVDSAKVLFEKALPVDAKRVPGELAWYRVASIEGKPVVDFGWVNARGEQCAKRAVIRKGVVNFKSKTYTLDAHGELHE